MNKKMFALAGKIFKFTKYKKTFNSKLWHASTEKFAIQKL